MVEHGTEDLTGRSHKIGVTKIGHTITGMKSQMKMSPISLEEYLSNEMLQNNEYI